MSKETPNKFKCSPTIWKKFSPFEKRFFNECYQSFNNKNLFPQVDLKKEELHIAAYNLACTAVWELPELLQKAIRLK